MTSSLFRTPGGRLSASQIVPSDRRRLAFVLALHELFGVAGPTVGVAAVAAAGAVAGVPRAFTPISARVAGSASARAFGGRITPLSARVTAAASARAFGGQVTPRRASAAGQAATVAPMRLVLSASAQLRAQAVVSPFGYARLILSSPPERTLVVEAENRVLSVH